MTDDTALRSQLPTAPGKLPGLGHLVQLGSRPLPFMQSLPGVGELAWIYLGKQPVLSVNTAELIHHMLVTDGRKYDKGKFFDKIRDTFGNGLPVSNGSFHMSQRRLLQPAFHRQRIAHYLETMRATAGEMVEPWQPGAVVPLKEWSMQLMLRMVARCLFSADVGGPVFEEINRSWATLVKSLAWRTMAPDFMLKLPTPGNRRYYSSTARMRKVMSDAVFAQRSRRTDDGSLLNMLFDTRDADTGEGMADEQIMAEMFLLLFAGTETSAFMIVWFFLELSRNPEIERRVHAEIDSVLSGRELSWEDLTKLTYVRQVITECLRVHNPSWMFMRRANVDVELRGHHIPEDTQLVFSLFALHRNADQFPDPMRFDPDRWRPGATDVADGAFIPFLEGRRQCIGDGFAWAQMTAAVVAIASRFRLRPGPGKPVKELAGGLMAPSEFTVRLEARG